MPALGLRIILGIGNPGPEYEGTRHNVGFMVVDQLAARFGITFEPAPGPVLVASGSTGAGGFRLVKPQAYVNRSGEALLGWSAGELLAPADVLVVLDDLALPVGTLRLRVRGSSGGHRGLRSVLEVLGTEAVPRLRVGVGGARAEEWREHVLSPFRPDEMAAVEAVLLRAVDGVLGFLEGRDPASLQSELNRASPPAADRGTWTPGTVARATAEPESAGRGDGRSGGSSVEQKLNKYEGMFLLHNGRIPAESGGASRLVTDLLKKHGASIVRVDLWDERKLAYPIKEQKRGTYVLAHFEAPSPAVSALNRDLSISEDILRALVLHHELEFPTFRTAAEMAALQPKREIFGETRRRGEDLDEEGGGRGRWRDEDDTDRSGHRIDDFDS